MSQTDPIAELLTRLRNAMRARYNQVEVAYSRLREAICRVLLAEGFLAGIETKGEGLKKQLVLNLRYSAAREPIIQGSAGEPAKHPSLCRRQNHAPRVGRTRRSRRQHAIGSNDGPRGSSSQCRRRSIVQDMVERIDVTHRKNAGRFGQGCQSRP
jgi:Ribosomal protein S8